MAYEQEKEGKCLVYCTNSFVFMRKTLTIFCCFLVLLTVRGQVKYNYRYWFDGDTSTMTTGTMTGNLCSVDLPTDGLTDWYHFLHLQVQDEAGTWSSTVTKFFAIVPEVLTSHDVTGQPYRYWFDGDASTMTTGTMTGNLCSIDLPTDGLTDWYHFLHLQVQDEAGAWSSTVTKLFAVVPEVLACRDVTGQLYRYWFDGDASTMTTGTMTGNLCSVDLPTDGLTDWYHFLHLQVQDETGAWSSTVTKLFAIVPEVLTSRDVTGQPYRYWFDDNASTTTTGTMTGNVLDLEPFVMMLSDGSHTIFFQVRNQNGSWSSVVSESFIVSSKGLTIMADGGGKVTFGDDILCDTIAEYNIPFGSTVNFSVSINDGYVLSSMMLNGTQEIKDQLVDGKLSLTVEEATAIVVKFDLTDFMKLGDVNDDKRVSAADVALTVDYLIGGKPSPFVRRQADANSDGEINVGDLARIVDFITGAVPRGSVEEVKEKKRKEKNEGDEKNGFADMLSGCLTAQGLDIALRNDMEYTTFQMALTLPEGTEIDDVQIAASRSDGHQVASGWLDDGRLNVVVYSGDNSPLLGSDGSLFHLYSTQLLQGEILVDDIVFVTKSGVVCKFAPFVIGGADGMGRPTPDLSRGGGGEAGAMYDLGGRRIPNGQVVRNKLPRGIYIVGGKKIIFK